MGNIFQVILQKDTSGWLLRENIAIPLDILFGMYQAPREKMLGKKTFTITEQKIQDLLKDLMEEVLLFAHSISITQILTLLESLYFIEMSLLGLIIPFPFIHTNTFSQTTHSIFLHQGKMESQASEWFYSME